MPLENLEHAMRVLERRILFRRRRLERPHQVVERRARALRDQVLRDRPRSLRPALIRPGRVVVPTLEPVVRPERGLGELHDAREHAVQVLGVLEVVADDVRGVGVVDGELLEEGVRVPPLRVDDVIDQTAEERDVRAGADRDVQVRHRAGAGEAGVDVDQLRAVELRLHGPAERHRVALRHVRTHDHEAVGVSRLRGYSVAAPRPNRVPRPGTLELCHILAWFSMATTPRPRQNFWQTWLNSLSRVAPPSANMPGVMFTTLPLGRLSMNVPSRVFLISSATRSIAHSSSTTSQPEAPGLRCRTLVARFGFTWSW